MYQKLLTAENRRKLPPLYSQENVKDPIVWVKFFTPDSNWTFWATEFDQKDTFFGLVKGHETELGYFSLSELQSARGPMGLHIERDMHFKPKPLSQVRAKSNPGIIRSNKQELEAMRQDTRKAYYEHGLQSKEYQDEFRKLHDQNMAFMAASYRKERGLPIYTPTPYDEPSLKKGRMYRNPFPSVIAKLAGMRKPQNFVVYPPREDGLIMVQSDKAIGVFDPKTGRGLLNWRGSNSKYGVHLNRQLGAEPYQFPPDFVQKSISEQPHSGQRLSSVLTVANPKMMNDPSIYYDTGYKEGEARRHGDEAAAKFHSSWFRKAYSLERGDENKTTAYINHQQGYREGVGPGAAYPFRNPSNMYKLRFERSSWPTDDFIGTIRTVPENYYVATVTDRGALIFRGIEGMTRNINQKMVRNWWKAQRNLSNPYEKTKPPYHRKGDLVPDYWELAWDKADAGRRMRLSKHEWGKEFKLQHIRPLRTPINGKGWVYEAWKSDANLKKKTSMLSNPKGMWISWTTDKNGRRLYFKRYHATMRRLRMPKDEAEALMAMGHPTEKYSNPGGIAGAAGSLAHRKKINPQQLSTSDIRCPHCQWKPRKGLSFGDSLQQVQTHYFKKHPSDPVGLKHGRNPIGAIAAALGTAAVTGMATGAGVGAGLIGARKILTGKAS